MSASVCIVENQCLRTAEEVIRPTLTHARGNDYAWGRMVGEAEKDRIANAQKVLEELPVFRAHQPWWLPYPIYLYFSEWMARQSLEATFTKQFPRLSERLRGMADGAEVRRDTLLLFHMLEAACNQGSSQNGATAPPPGGCTAIVCGAQRVIQNETVILHNLDQVPQASPFLTVRESAPSDEFRSIHLTLSPLCGVVDGMNEHGLAISYNYAAAIETATDGTLISLAISHALSRCKTVGEAITCITSRPRSHGAMLMISDASGTAARLEISGTRYHVELLQAADETLFHSNSYRSPDMLDTQVSAEAVYGELCPESIRGRRVLESSELRDLRLQNILSEIGKVDCDDVFHLLQDHGEQGEASANTICMHGPYWSTIASVRMLPRSRVFSVAYGSACQSEFQHFSF